MISRLNESESFSVDGKTEFSVNDDVSLVSGWFGLIGSGYFTIIKVILATELPFA